MAMVWTRTDLDYETPSGYTSLRFDETAMAAFDLHILKRPGSHRDYSEGLLEKAAVYAARLHQKEIDQLVKNILAGLPGAQAGYSLAQFQCMLDSYKGIGDEQLRDHLYEFVREIAPIAEQANVRLGIHPDDPP